MSFRLPLFCDVQGAVKIWRNQFGLLRAERYGPPERLPLDRYLNTDDLLRRLFTSEGKERLISEAEFRRLLG